MIKKIFPGMLALLVCCSMAACSSGGGEPLPAQAVEPEADYVEIAFHFERQSGNGSNQFAVWIEDMEGHVVRTLYATNYIATGGYTRRPEAIPNWVERSGVKFMDGDEIDAITGATPDTSDLAFLWDLTDQDGSRVPAGEYAFFVEGTLYMSNRVLYTGVIDISGVSTTAQATAAYVYEGTNEEDTLSEESPENAIITSVSAVFLRMRMRHRTI